MLAVKARYDGRKIILPRGRPHAPPGEVVVIFAKPGGRGEDSAAWLRAQESAFSKVWDNDEDVVYDKL
jgi:hypothetical protein